MADEIERANGEIRWWLERGLRIVWPAAPGKRPDGPCFVQRYADGRWWSTPLPSGTTAHPAPEWPL